MPVHDNLITARVAQEGTGGAGPSLFVWIQDRLHPARIIDNRITELAQHDIVRCRMDGSGVALIEALERSGNRFNEDILRWRRPDCSGRSRITYLKLRNRIRKAVEGYFAGEDFIHIPSPVHVRNPNPEPQFDILTTGSGCLITSPELQLKRLLTGGFERIYSLVPCFRGRETDRTHNPEFTMLEWYRTGCGLDTMRDDLKSLILTASESCGSGNVEEHFNRSSTDLAGDWDIRTVRELVQEHLELDIRGCVSAPHLHELGMSLGLFTADQQGERFEQLFSRLWSRFESGLGKSRPLIITEWPIPLASLAAPSMEDGSVALRMELVIDGMELANGFYELTDPAEQDRRMRADSRMRQELLLPATEPDSAFLESVHAGLPASSGMALGFERLCMLLLNAPDIRSVLPFTFEEL